MCGYVALLRDRRLLALAGASGFFYAGTFAYISGSPFAYMTFYYLPARNYGLLFGTGMVTNLVNARLVVRFGTLRLWGLEQALQRRPASPSLYADRPGSAVCLAGVRGCGWLSDRPSRAGILAFRNRSRRRRGRCICVP